MFSLRLAALILHDSLHGESRICCLSHHREMATATQRRNNTTKQSNHIKAISKLYSNPSRIQSNISVLTEIEVTLQSIQDIEHLHKTQTRFWKLTWMRHDENDWSFQDTIQADSAALPSIHTFSRLLQRCWQSTTMASEPRVGDKPTILEPLQDVSASSAATQTVYCKRKTISHQPRD